MVRHRKIDPRELIPATRPKQAFERGPIPPAPILGNTKLDFVMTGLAQIQNQPVKFELPTTRVKPRGVVFVYDMTFEHSDTTQKLTSVMFSRQAPEDTPPGYTIFRHQTIPGLTLPYVLNFATPLPFPFAGDAIYNYTPAVWVAFSAAGAAFSVAVLNFNWVFYEWDAARSGGQTRISLGGFGGGGVGAKDAFTVSE